MESVDLSKLKAYPGEFRMELIKKLYNALNLEQEGILVMPNIKNTLILHKLLTKKGVKPYTGKFNAKGNDFGFEPRELKVEKAQRDWSIEPSKYLPTYMASLRGRGESANNMTIPFAQVMWEAALEELATELNTETVYHGVGKAAFAAYAAGTAYAVGALVKYTQDNELRYFRCVAATVAGQNPDTNPEKWEDAGARALNVGFGKIITDEIAEGDIVPVATGAVNNTNAYDKFTQIYRAHPEPVKAGKHGKVITLCSYTDYEALTDDYENKIKKNFDEIDGITYLAKTNRNNIIKPVSWLSGSRRLISTLPNNLVAGTDQMSDMNEIKVMEQMYHLEAGLTFMLGFQIADLAAMKVSDQA